MKRSMVDKIFSDTSYIRTAGSENELRCARYLADRLAEMSIGSHFEDFSITLYDTSEESLKADGREIPCKAYGSDASAEVSGKLVYLGSADARSLKKCKDGIVLTERPITKKLYTALVENGAIGFIACTGNTAYADREIDRRMIRFPTDEMQNIPGVTVNVSDALWMLKNDIKTVELSVRQTKREARSYNLIADIEGETDEMIVISAHYDTTSLSIGAYDNMSSCIGLLCLAEYFKKNKPHRKIRLLWCSAEEIGLVGSRKYCEAHTAELEKTVLNINLDMLGSLMGEFVVFSCADTEMPEFIRRFLKKHRVAGEVRDAIRSSDSSAFVYAGIPAVSFARYAPPSVAPIHTVYDGSYALGARRLLDDMRIITEFAREISDTSDLSNLCRIGDKIRKDADDYMNRW